VVFLYGEKMRSKQHGKRLRQEGAIKRLENTVTMHEANTELTLAIMGDKNLSTGAADKVESIRAKKIERAKKTIENTKEKLR
tara:strand:- start:219 stop:464 length:246 start_codon:yes stop_codon:yes gene_type:complete